MGAKVFQDVLYAQCWEDPQVDREAFALGPGDVVFTITSGGCNALAFLLDDPAQVIALDYNAHQNHVLELKMAALRVLEHAELLRFVGVHPAADRAGLYARVRPHLSEAARTFWDARPAKIRRGLLHAGRFEDYLRLVRTWVRRLMGPALVDAFFRLEDAADRRRLFRRRWDGVRWRALTGLLLSRATMTLLFDKAFFAQLEKNESFGANFRGRLEHALTRLPVRENPFLSYMLTGGFQDGAALPLWLRPENHEPIRERLDRVEVVTGSCLDWLSARDSSSVTHFNFTNVFEWVSPTMFREALEQTARVGTDGAVLTYRNLLVPRSRPAGLDDRIQSHPERSRSLHAQDLSFIYRRYVVETVRKKEAASCAA